MIYVENTNNYPQRVYIPRDEGFNGELSGYQFQRKDYVINENGLTHIHPDPGYDGITGGSISVYVNAATGVTFEHLDVTEDGIYVPTGDTAYSGVTVQIYDAAYQHGFDDGYASGHTDGFQEGYSSGHTDGYNEGWQDGFASGSTSGFQEGYASGRTDGYQNGFQDGYASGRTDGFQDGYASGFTDGVASVRLTTIETGVNTNDTYEFTPPSGFSGFQSVKINVNVPGSARLMDGYTAGINNYTYYPPEGYDGFTNFRVEVPTTGRTPILTSATFTSNGTFTPDEGVDGFSAVTIVVDSAGTYSQGFADGVAHQKSLLASTAFTENDTYTRTNGWNSVTVNVPTGPGSLGTVALTCVYKSTNNQSQNTATATYAQHGWYTQESDGEFDVCGAYITIPSAGTKTVRMYTMNYTTTPLLNEGLGLREVVISDDITAIAGSTFNKCKNLTAVTLSNNITEIPIQCFAGCTSLPSIDIPSGVTKLEYHAFADCTSLTSITSRALVAPHVTGDYPFSNVPSTGTLYVPTGSDYSSWLNELGSGWTVQYI